ncbi:MAG TPA: AAA family ATPase [Actinomycetota bacterium]|nr:AAA family ATPase [Actinomycetota bacterium]
MARPAEVLDAAVEESAEQAGPGSILTVASATGGCGKTFFATNVAALAARGGKRVVLVDLDLQFGEVAAALQIRPQYSLYDGLYGQNGKPLPEGTFAEHLDELVVRHPLGFDVLTAPRDPALADYVGARDADAVLDVVARSYDVVVVDTPPSLNEIVLTALERSDVVTVMATLDIPSLKNLSVFLDTLRRLKVDDSRLRLVLNKIDKDVGIDVKQTQEAFNDRFVGFIPQSRAVSRAMNIGRVVIETEPRSSVARKVTDAIVAVVPADLRPASSEASSSGIWARLRRLFTKGTNS